MSQRLLTFSRYLFVLLCTIGAVCTLLGFLGAYDWRFDLLSHFRLQYIVLFLFLFIWALLLKSKYFITASLLFILINSIQFLPFYMPEKTHATDTSLLVFMANVEKGNRELPNLIDTIHNANPDIIILEEIDNAGWQAVRGLSTTYPYGIAEVREDFFGIVLFSKHPLVNPRIEWMGYYSIPVVVSDIELDGRMITLIGTHPVPPFNRYNTRARNDQIEELGRFINRQSFPVLLVGDMNSTPFSYPYRKLLRDTKLSNCANGFGYQSTWHYEPHIPPFGLAIDQCFHTDGIGIQESFVGEDIGSDHRPILNSISIRES